MNGTEFLMNIVVPLAAILGLFWSFSDSTRRSGFKSSNAIFVLAVIILGTMAEFGLQIGVFTMLIGGFPLLGKFLGGLLDAIWGIVFPIFRAFYIAGASIAWIELIWLKVMYPAIISLPIIGSGIESVVDYLAGKR